jgi:hypothetical protein
MNLNHEAQAYRSLRRRNRNREDGKHHTRQQLGMGPVSPEGNQVQIRRIQHQLNPNQHQDGVAARQRSGEANGEQQGGNKQMSC